jgi:hypothetical protein
MGVTGLSVLSIILGTLATTSLYSMEAYITTALGFSFLSMVIIQLLAGTGAAILTVAQAAPLISEEVELQSWRLLRTTSLSLREIIFAKFTAILSQLRAQLVGLLALRIISLITGLLLLSVVLLRETFYYFDATSWREFWTLQAWLPALLSLTILVVFYVAQPMIQFLINVALGLAASAHANSRSRAIAAALALRLITWIASILFGGALIFGVGFLFINWIDPQFAPLPGYDSLADPSPERLVFIITILLPGYLMTLLLSQVGILLFALGITQRRARTLL